MSLIIVKGKKDMQKILLIIYYWPPSGGSGVQRWVKFIKYLQQFGWDPTVITTKDGDYPILDHSLLKEIPSNIKIIRTKTPVFKNIFKKFVGKQSNIPYGSLKIQKDDSWLQKLLIKIRINFIIPDLRKIWNKYAFKAAAMELQTNKYDLIITSGPPHSTHLVGLKLKQKFKVKWLADFRDPWTDIHYYENVNRLAIAKFIDINLEKKVLQNCDKLITVSPKLKQIFENKYPKIDCKVIYNGFDESDFSNIKTEKRNKFVLSYIGNFKDNQNVISLWEAIAKLLSNDEFAKDFQLELTGRVSNNVISSLKQNNLWKYTKIEGYVKHKTAIQRMKNASVLLFIIPQAKSNKGILTGKLFDYLASGSPFLSIGNPEGDAAKILHKTKAGPMLNYTAINEIEQYIIKLYENWKQDKLADFEPCKDEINKFNRKSLTKELAEVIEKI